MSGYLNALEPISVFKKEEQKYLKSAELLWGL